MYIRSLVAVDRSYIGESRRALGTGIKENQKATIGAEADKSGIPEHAWAEQHHLILDKALVIGKAKILGRSPRDG